MGNYTPRWSLKFPFTRSLKFTFIYFKLNLAVCHPDVFNQTKTNFALGIHLPGIFLHWAFTCQGLLRQKLQNCSRPKEPNLGLHSFDIHLRWLFCVLLFLILTSCATEQWGYQHSRRDRALPIRFRTHRQRPNGLINVLCTQPQDGRPDGQW